MKTEKYQRGASALIAEKRNTKLLIGLIALIVLAIGVLVILHAVKNGRDRPEPVAVTPRPSAEVIVREKEVEKIVTVEKEITSEILRDGVREVGVLETEEYYFTEVVGYSSVKKLWNIELGITESSYLVSYDGVVRAGVDLSGAEVVKDDEKGCITVTLPAAEIQSVDIDPESFRLYSEKAGLGNHISAEDFNNSLIELETTAREKALERGLLERADGNARVLIRNLIGALIDLNAYSIEFVTRR